MRGTDTFEADPRVYSINVTAADLKINQITSYAIRINVIDSLTPTGYIEIALPSQLAL